MGRARSEERIHNTVVEFRESFVRWLVGPLILNTERLSVITDRNIALKFMPPSALESGSARQRFKREITLAAKLEHPNIARVYDAAVDRVPFFFAMQFVDGGHLNRHVRTTSATPQAIAELFELLTGELPFRGRSDAILKQVMSGE